MTILNVYELSTSKFIVYLLYNPCKKYLDLQFDFSRDLSIVRCLLRILVRRCVVTK
jgi:hypothetical protein